MIEHIKIPLVFDHPFKSNVWFPNYAGTDINDIHRSTRFQRQIPWILQTFDPLLSIHSAHEIDNLDWFIYPVSMNEPYYQVRSLIGNYHHDYGFWSFISPPVIKSLREKKGWILIDATLEPLRDDDLANVLKAIDDCSEFPNDRILINVSSLKHVNHPQVVSLPSWLELHYCGTGIHEYKDEKKLADRRGEGIKKSWTLLGSRLFDLRSDYKPSKKRFSLFQQRWYKHVGSAVLMFLMDKADFFKFGHVTADELDSFSEYFVGLGGYKIWKNVGESLELKHSDDVLDPVTFVVDYQKASNLNIVVEAYYYDDVVDWSMITEKIWRNVGYRKPFIVVGQKGLLDKFHTLGYKSFHPHINESYDREADESRVLKAFLQIKKFIEMSEDEVKDLLLKFEDIHNHNDYNFQKRVSSTYFLFLAMSKNDTDSIRQFTFS